MGKRKKYPVLMTGCILLTGALLFSSCGKKEQDSDIEKEKPEIVPKEQEIMGLENIASYIELEKIGNDGMTRLMEMKAGYEWAGEGSLILNGFDEEEKAVAKRILDASDRVACWMIYRDFDGDGVKEAFVYACDLASGKGTELWFAAADGTVQKLLEANTYRTQNILELPEKTFYLYTIEGAYARGAFLYEVEGNTAKPAALQGAEYLGDGKFVVDCTGDNAFSLEAGGDAGSCWRNYYYYYDENGFHEYSGSPVTEEEFCQYENGSELLDAVKQCGDVEEIYYFADGRMIVNYVEDGVILDELYGGLVRRNHYLQVPILSEGEDGFVLAAENFSNILLMQRGELVGERGEHDLFVGDGNYQPFCQEELAKYPVYQSPLEYYREGYLEKAGDPEQILTDGIYQKGQEYLVDLDGDGAEESLFVGQKLLLVDGKNYNKFLYMAEPRTYSMPHTVQCLTGNAVHRFVGVICNLPTKPMNL